MHDEMQADAGLGGVAVGLDLGFGEGEAGSACLGEGWGRPDGTGVASIGHRGVIRLALPAGTWLLEVELRARLAPPALTSQAVAFFLDGVALGRERLQSHEVLTLGYVVTSRGEAGVLEIRTPQAPEGREVGRGGRARLGISLHRVRLVAAEAPCTAAPRRWAPVCAAEGGDRFMTGALVRVVGGALRVSPEALALRFESLGHNCEFGMVQTSWGASPLGLLRFNSCALQPLLGGLDCGFDDMDDPVLSRLRWNIRRGRSGSSSMTATAR